MNILFIATECIPYCKTGGVADAVNGLAKELNYQGHDVRIVIPCYRGILDQSRMKKIIPKLIISHNLYTRDATIWKSFDNLLAYLVQHDFYFGRNELYGYLDDYRRFIFFARAALEMLCDEQFKTEQWFPDIIQGYDWSTGLIPFWLREYEKQDERFKDTRFILSIYNIGRLGIFNSTALGVANIEEAGIFNQIGEKATSINFLGRGILSADKIITFNPQYSPQNPLPESAKSINAIINNRREKGDMVGIRNAIDYEKYNPNNALFRFNESSINSRIKNKKALQEEFGFEQNYEIPFLGMVSLLTWVKGFDLIPEFISNLLKSRDFQLVILCEPLDLSYKKKLFELEQKLEIIRGNKKSWLKIIYEFDEQVAQKIYSSTDIFLLPSREEPCGVQQYIAMHYGAIPVVHHIGALNSSIISYKPGLKIDDYAGKSVGIGFTFNKFSIEEFSNAVLDAMNIFKTQKNIWIEIQRHNMREDFSWFRPAKKYFKIYRESLAKERVSIPNGEPLQLDREGQLHQAIIEIDSLPGLAKRDNNELLKQAARLIREVVQCDTVFVWMLGKSWQAIFEDATLQEGMQLASASYDPSHKGKSIHKSEIDRLSYDVLTGIGRQFPDLEMSNICRPILNLSESKIASKEGWVDGRTIPITSHSRILGRIDILFKRQIAEAEDEWLMKALTYLAISFGVRLETIRQANESDQIIERDCELMKYHSLHDTVDKIIKYAMSLSNAEDCCLYLNENGKLIAYNSSNFADPGLEIAYFAMKNKIVKYITDCSTRVDYLEYQLPFRSLMAVPLFTNVGKKKEIVGVVELASKQPAAFSRDEERSITQQLAPQAAAALSTTNWIEKRDKNRVIQLEKLSGSLIVRGDFNQLLEQVVQTTAEVLNTKAASLYLINDKNLLEIRAAAGYHLELLKEKAFYEIGEGITGWVAECGIIFKADSAEELHAHPNRKSKYLKFQKNIIPQNSLCIPLKVAEQISSKRKVIGVLKLEDKYENNSINKRKNIFTEEDIRLGEMMANVIATVVHNTQVSSVQFQMLSNNLKDLSIALSGGREMRDLMNQIVETTARVLGAEASSLYLIDEKSNLVIQAATGYQKPLVEKRATYTLGEGVTGWIAAEGKRFRANNLQELHDHPAWKGAQNPAQGNREPKSFLGLPLKVFDRFTGKEKVIGVLKVEEIIPSDKHPKDLFTDQDELLVEMMANVIATVVHNTQVSSKQFQMLSNNLKNLSVALSGGREMRDLMNQIVETTAGVLGAEASSLYLIDEKRNLVIQAATGYQKPLVERRATYTLGEGVTGWIAAKGEPFRANNLDELHRHPAWKGAQNPAQGNREPKSFLGLPLKVFDRFTGQEKVIGVLKVEDIVPSEKHPEALFSDQDVLLVAMMANVIATVVYNTQVSTDQLQKLSSNLEELSKVLSGGREMRALVDQIVETTARVLGAEASSLYLIDEATGNLVIQAATGYQKSLVERHATYILGEGVTGWIAAKGEPFRANNLLELHKHPAWKGKQNPAQRDREPRSFLGLPLKVFDQSTGQDKVIGVLKVEDIVPSEKHPEALFTDQDVLLVTMMANVIATVINNTRWGEARIGNILQKMGILSEPVDVTKQLLQTFSATADSGIIDQLAIAISLVLDERFELTEKEAKTLFEVGANSSIYGRISSWAKNESVKWYFKLLDCILNKGIRYDNWEHVNKTAKPWINLMTSENAPKEFKNVVDQFAAILSNFLQTEFTETSSDSSNTWFGAILDASRIFGEVFGNQMGRIPMLFQRQGKLDEDNLDRMHKFAQEGLKRPYQIIILVLWNFDVSSERIKDIQQRMRIHAMDVVAVNVSEMIDIFLSPRPEEAFRALVLRQITTTSPFVIVGPVPDAMFFGREREIKEIIQFVGAGRSCAIIGGRRIGKTSILQRLHRVRLPDVGFRTIYHSCETIRSYKSFLSAIIRNWRPEPPSDAPKTFGNLLQNPPTDKPLVILLDEADILVPIDYNNKWQLFNMLRDLINSGKIQVVLSGERTLREALRNPGSPLFNFANEMLLGPLEYRDVKELVTRPIKQLEIELINEETIVQNIWDNTSGHPNVVQRLCRRLIERLNKMGTHTITAEDVNSVINDPGFQRDDFLDTFWERATALEKIISLLLVDNKTLRTLKAIREGLHDRCKLSTKVKEVDGALQRLVDLRSILKRTPTGYEFAIESFPKVVAGTITLEDMLESLTEEYQEEKSK